MIDRNTIPKVIESLFEDWIDKNINVHPLAVENMRILEADALALLKEQEAKQYNNHEVACIITDLFGDPCACNFNNIDEWLPYKCDFRETCCPNPVGVACWEQYLKHKEGR